MDGIVVEIVWKESTSTKGNKYEGLFAILPNGQEVLLSINKVTYFTILKKSK